MTNCKYCGLPNPDGNPYCFCPQNPQEVDVPMSERDELVSDLYDAASSLDRQLSELSHQDRVLQWPETILIRKAADRIQELEAHVEALQDKIWEHDCACSYDEPGDVCMMHSPVVKKLEAQLSGVHAGTHCIVPFEFIELAVDPVSLEECGNSKDLYICNISNWAKQVQSEAHPYLVYMLSATTSEKEK